MKTASMRVMNKMTTPFPHDALYKGCMKDLRIAKDFLSHHLPAELLDQVVLDSLKIEDGSFIDKELKASSADVLYSMDFKNKQKGYIYAIAEHQSTPDKMAPFRFMQYSFKAMQYDLDRNPGRTVLPVVYVLVFYNGAKPYTYSTDFFDLFGANKELAIKTFNEPFKLIDVKQLSNEELKSHKI